MRLSDQAPSIPGDTATRVGVHDFAHHFANTVTKRWPTAEAMNPTPTDGLEHLAF